VSSLRPLWALFAVLALCSIGTALPALAQTTEPGEGDCVEGPCGVQAPTVDNVDFHGAPLAAILRRGQPFVCGAPADAKTETAEVDCRIHATISVPAKAAKFLGLRSRVLAQGEAGDRVEHYDGQGRAYFLTLPSALRSKLKAKRVRGLGVTITGKITVAGADQIYCADSSKLHASCSIDYGKKANAWSAPDGELVCWSVMPWWVATKSPGWGKMCPKPINA
jgi:hypothetical protein